MKYKILKDLPWAKEWEIIDSDRFRNIWFIGEPSKYPDFFEPIVEKKTYDDLMEGDTVYTLDMEWKTTEWEFFKSHCRSELFLTREEAEDEHKRREWACRKDKFIPKEWEKMFYFWWDNMGLHNKIYCEKFWKESNLLSLIVNSWLAFRTEEECEKAIKEHDLIRLFYTIH